jgi:hypothetical protein
MHNSLLNSNQIMFFINILEMMVIFSSTYTAFKIILSHIGCENTNYLNTKNKSRSMTTQWLLISTFVTIYLGITPLLKHGYFVDHINCNVLENTPIKESITLLSVFVGYLWYDLLFNNISTMYKCHHLLCSLSVVMVVCKNHSPGVMFSELLMMAEISTIFLNLKMITDGFLNKMFSFLFMITFILFRPLYMPQVFLKMIECFKYDVTYIIIVVSFASLLLMNFYWGILIIRKGFITFINADIKNINKMD